MEFAALSEEHRRAGATPHMICPVEIAREMSAFRAARVAEDAGHVLLHEGRDGAGDEKVTWYKPRSSAPATDTCGAGASATRSSARTGCLIEGGEGLRPNGYRWSWSSRCWDCIATASALSHGIILSFAWTRPYTLAAALPEVVPPA